MACQGSEETPIDTDNNGVFFLNSKTRSVDIPDGSANTIFFGETIIPREFADSDFKTKKIMEDKISNCRVVRPEDGEELWFCAMGWMSGTGATLRNAGNPINTISGPFAASDAFVKMIAENVERSTNVLNGGLTAWADEEGEAEERKEWKPFVVPTELWETPHPAEKCVGSFSSNHINGANFILGDGSLRFISDQIDPNAFQRLANRRDSEKQK